MAPEAVPVFVPVVAPKPRDNVTFDGQVLPFVRKYCIGCHNENKNAGGFALDSFRDLASLKKERGLWESVQANVRDRLMPPKTKPQPTQLERDIVVEWLDANLGKVECGLVRDAGRVTMRRLNRSEYNNTIRDLVGVNFQPADDFPSDDVGYGFDNIGDVLSLPPVLLEKYLAAAEKILDAAIVEEIPVKVAREPFRIQNLQTRPKTLKDSKDNKKPIGLLENKHAAYIAYEVIHEAEYIVRVKAYGDRAGNELPRLDLQVDQKSVKAIDIDATEKPKVYEHRLKLMPGRRTIDVAFINDFVDKEAKDPKKRDRNLYVTEIEIEGPFNVVSKPLPLSHRRLMIAKPTAPAEWDTTARNVLTAFVGKAWRRPATIPEIDRLMKLVALAKGNGDSFEKSVSLAMRAVLVSPNFLFRVEIDRDPKNPTAVSLVSEYELATRLSYFLWSSMPDEELTTLAAAGKLREKGAVAAQVARMLKDPKSRALTENFAGQWLQLRNLQTATPDRKTFPAWNDDLRKAMIRETETYFDHIVREDRSVLEFLDSDYTFLNSRLAKHYGIDGVSGEEFRKVVLKDKARGGILTHASILTLTSNPTRTSPVKRGKWVLDTILNTPPPPPPPDVGELPDDKNEPLKGTLRQRLEAHRSNPVCASCHQRMDPLGFGLENFNAVGAWRTQDAGFNIDPSGVLPAGEAFAGPAELRKILLGKADLFRKCLADRLLTYAIGRGLESSDKCSTDDLGRLLGTRGDKFSALVLAIVESEPFQKRKGPKK